MDGVAVMRVTRGQVFTVTSSVAVPGSPNSVTVNVRLSAAAAPFESVTVSVTTTGPLAVGAVHSVLALPGALKLPAPAVHA